MNYKEWKLEQFLNSFRLEELKLCVKFLHKGRYLLEVYSGAMIKDPDVASTDDRWINEDDWCDDGTYVIITDIEDDTLPCVAVLHRYENCSIEELRGTLENEIANYEAMKKMAEEES